MRTGIISPILLKLYANGYNFVYIVPIPYIRIGLIVHALRSQSRAFCFCNELVTKNFKIVSK